MTSVLRRYAQIEPRIQYFIVLDTVQGYINTSNFVSTSPLMTLTDFSGAFVAGGAQIASATLLKDMGRQITVYDPANNNAHIAIFRQVMLVNGLNVEGVPTISTGIPYVPPNSYTYICTWVDTPTRPPPFVLAVVSRTG